MTGVQQDQTAGQALMQYLHAAIVILPGSNATTLNASILAGVNSSGTAQTATLQAVLTELRQSYPRRHLHDLAHARRWGHDEHRHLRRRELLGGVHVLLQQLQHHAGRALLHDCADECRTQ